ncbi:MAG: hypothetical protein KDB27_04020 [Planctomycetales bacterium]|nr:hypothetical protein [Planctomycetales bacterium]
MTSTGNETAVVVPLSHEDLSNWLPNDRVMHPLYLHSVLMNTNAYKTKVQERMLGQNGPGRIMRVGTVGNPNPMSLGGILHRVNDSVSEIAVAVKGDAIRYAGEGNPKTTVTSPSSSVVSDLDNSTVPSVFSTNLSLTGNATVKVQIQGSQWRIRDDTPATKLAYDIWTTPSGDLEAYSVLFSEWENGIADVTMRLAFTNRSDLLLDYTGLFGLSIDPDYIQDGIVNNLDIDAFNAAVNDQSATVAEHDIDGDGDVDQDDLAELVFLYVGTFFGDANVDGVFNSTDLVVVSIANEYEDGENDNSTWAEGDWNGDLDYTSADWVLAMLYGGYDPS